VKYFSCVCVIGTEGDQERFQGSLLKTSVLVQGGVNVDFVGTVDNLPHIGTVIEHFF
jgi:rRNA processing protein Krr1/Pno1